MKKSNLKSTVALCLGLLYGSHAANAILMVDFGVSVITPPSSSPVATGFTGGNLVNAPVAATTPTFAWGSIMGVTGLANPVDISISASVPSGNLQPNNLRAISRATGVGSANAVFLDWISVSQLGGTVAIPALKPTLSITLNGLVAGQQYLWKSFHHDASNQTGISAWTLDGLNGTVDGSNGSTSTINAAATAFAGTTTITPDTTPVDGTPDNPATLSQSFTASSSTVVFTLSPTVSTTLTFVESNGVSFAVINGFTLEAVPEPSSALLGLFGALTLLRRRRC
jgi:hypothetical protein